MKKAIAVKPKPAQTFAIHKTYDKDIDGAPCVTLFVSDGINTQKLNPKKTLKFIEEIKPGSVIRSTMVNASDTTLLALQDKGAEIVNTHWHNTGIEKGQDPEAIVQAYSKLDISLFKPFTPRHDIAELRDALSARNAILKFYGDATRRLKQVGRNRGYADGGVAEATTKRKGKEQDGERDDFENLDAIYDVFKISVTGKNGKPREISLDKNVNLLAAKIPECKLFNEIAGIKGDSFISAASVVAMTGGMSRFPSVGSFWHYCGLHVVDGKAPKRRKGEPCSHSPKVRVALWLLADSLMKGKSEWRQYFVQARAQEREVHDQKCPNCRHPDGHSTAMAKRKMTKEILKRFYLAANNVPNMPFEAR